MAYTRFAHDAKAQVALPPALRDPFAWRLRKFADRWSQMPPLEHRPPWMDLLLGVHEACPEGKAGAWADLGEWSPGHLYALGMDYGADGTVAVVVWVGDLKDGHGPRVLVLAEVDIDPETGRLRP